MTRYSANQHAAPHGATHTGATGGRGRSFALAATLARKGRYAEASQVLQEAFAVGECAEADALDLQARIYVQQGLHLDAESCWRRAKALDGANPAYDQALDQLHRSRLSTGRLSRMFIVLALGATLALLLWQTFAANPSIAGRLRMTEASLTTITEQVAALQGAADSRDKQLDARLADLSAALSSIDARLSERIGTLQTASGAAQSHTAMVARLNEGIATLQGLLENQIGSLETRRAQSEAGTAERLDSLETVLARIANAVTLLEATLTKRLEDGDASLASRVESMANSIQQSVSALPQSTELAELRQGIADLRVQLSDVATVVKGIKGASDQTDSQEATKRQTDQAGSEGTEGAQR